MAASVAGRSILSMTKSAAILEAHTAAARAAMTATSPIKLRNRPFLAPITTHNASTPRIARSMIADTDKKGQLLSLGKWSDLQ